MRPSDWAGTAPAPRAPTRCASVATATWTGARSVSGVDACAGRGRAGQGSMRTVQGVRALASEMRGLRSSCLRDGRLQACWPRRPENGGRCVCCRPARGPCQTPVPGPAPDAGRPASVPCLVLQAFSSGPMAACGRQSCRAARSACRARSGACAAPTTRLAWSAARAWPAWEGGAASAALTHAVASAPPTQTSAPPAVPRGLLHATGAASGGDPCAGCSCACTAPRCEGLWHCGSAYGLQRPCVCPSRVQCPSESCHTATNAQFLTLCPPYA